MVLTCNIIKPFRILIFALILFVIVSNFIVEFGSSDYLYDSIQEVPYNKTGLVLGTSKYSTDGRLNLFFLYRIRTAVELYNSGKVSKLIVSGDNKHRNYNEPEIMKQELIDRGIPAEDIFADYAGFRTLDSVVRCNRIFGQESFTIISQKFHNQRAVYIGRTRGLDVVAFNTRDVYGRTAARTYFREIFARPKAILDIHITNQQPYFLGESIVID